MTAQVVEITEGYVAEQYLNTQLRLNIGTAGNSKNGVVILYIRVP
jgi:hypothetical protein